MADVCGLEERTVARQGDLAAVRMTKTGMAAFAAVVDKSGTFEHRHGFLEGHIVNLLRVHDFSLQLVRTAHAGKDERIFVQSKP